MKRMISSRFPILMLALGMLGASLACSAPVRYEQARESDTSVQQKAVEKAIKGAEQIPVSPDTRLSGQDLARVQALIDGANMCNESLKIKTGEAAEFAQNLGSVRTERAILQTKLEACEKKHQWDWVTDWLGEVGAWWRGFGSGYLACIVSAILVYGAYKIGILRRAVGV